MEPYPRQPDHTLTRTTSPMLGPYSSELRNQNAAGSTEFSHTQTLLSLGDSASDHSRSNSRAGSTLIEYEGALDQALDLSVSDNTRLHDNNPSRLPPSSSSTTQQTQSSFTSPIISDQQDSISEAMHPESIRYSQQRQQQQFLTGEQQQPSHRHSQHPLSALTHQRHLEHNSNTMSHSPLSPQFSRRHDDTLSTDFSNVVESPSNSHKDSSREPPFSLTPHHTINVGNGTGEYGHGQGDTSPKYSKPSRWEGDASSSHTYDGQPTSNDDQTVPEIIIQFTEINIPPITLNGFSPSTSTSQPTLLQSLLPEETTMSRPSQDNDRSKRIISIPPAMDLSTLRSRTEQPASHESTPEQQRQMTTTGQSASTTAQGLDRKSSWGWKSLRRRQMQQGGDRDHSHEEQLYDEGPQPTTSTVPSPTLYSPHSPFTPRTLAHDEQSSKYNSIKSTYLTSSVPTLVTPTPFPPSTLRGMPSSIEGAGVGDQPPATDSTLKLRKKSSSSILLLSTIPETSETGKRYVNPNNRKKERKKELKLLKTLFSNERTYVHWLKLGMMMGALAMTLLNFSTLSASAALATNGGADGGNGGQLEILGAKQGESLYVAHGLFRRSPTVSTSSSPSPSPSTNSTSHSVDPEMVALAMMLGKVGQYVGAFILLVCMIFLAYATASFHWRHVGIAKWKMDGRYYDRWGPTILTILLVSAYTANIYLTMQATAKLGNGYQPKVFYNIHPTTSSSPPASNTIGHGGVSSRYPHASPTPSVITSDDDDTTSGIEDEDTRDRYNTPTPSVFRAISGGQAEATATAAGVPNAIAGSVPTAPSRTGQVSSTPTTSETTYDDTEDDEEDGGYGDDEEDEEE